MEELCVSIQQIQSGLESCQGLSASQIIASFMEESFTDQLRHGWEVYSVDIVDPPTTDEIMEFLKRRMANLSISTKSCSSYSSSSHHKPSPSTVKTRGHVFQAEEKKDVSCALCKGDMRGFGKCPTFKSWNQQKCYNHIRSVNACMNCLHPGHNSRDCQSIYKCRNCGLNHHTLLHREKENNSHENRSSATSGNNSANTSTAPIARIQNSNESAILSTALVNVSSEGYMKSTRLLMDSGASISLITSSLAQELQAKLSPCEISISGVGGEAVSKHVTNVTLSSAFHDDGDSITVQCHVVEKLVETLPCCNLSSIHQLPCLEGKQMADPGFGKTSKIEILLGVGDCNKVFHQEFIQPENTAILITETLFGWTISGQTSSVKSSGIVLSVSQSKTKATDQLLPKQTNMSAYHQEDTKYPSHGNHQENTNLVNRGIKH